MAISPVRYDFYVPPFPWDLDMLPFVMLEDCSETPPIKAVYFFRTEQAVLYIGESVHLQNRCAHHERLRYLRDIPEPVMLAWMPFPHANQVGLKALEYKAITFYQPILNGVGVFYVQKPTQGQVTHIATAHARIQRRLARFFPEES